MKESKNEQLIQGIAFERVVLKVLKSYNKNLSIDNYIEDKLYIRSDFIYDAYCEEKLDLSPFGYGQIYGKRIGIEIKKRIPTISQIMKILKKSQEIIDVLVLISAGHSNTLVKELHKNQLDRVVIVLDRKIIEKNDDVKKVLNSFDKYIVQENNMLIENHYDSLLKINDNLSFALGAGCSINSNISDWNRLSEALGFELLFNIVDNKDSIYKNMNIINELNNKLFGCYEKTSALDAIYNCYIKSPEVDQLDYYNAIKTVLYMSYDSPSDANKPLIESIKNCIGRRNIKEIINYNFDSVLEQNYNNKYKSKPSEILASKTKIGGCDIYHVHGYIPYDYNGNTNVNNFVFTDKEYYDNMMNSNNLSNLTQQRILEKYNVIFVGVSFTDANLKVRLRERLNNYPTNKIFAFFKLPSFEGIGTEKKLMENKYKFIQQSYFDSLGVKILWVNDFNEIPKEIDKI